MSSKLTGISPLTHMSIRALLFFYFLFYLFIYLFFVFSRAAPKAYGGSQARGLIGATATGLCQSHSQARSELRLRPVPQLMATPDP